jgi:hypothetical protein
MMHPHTQTRVQKWKTTEEGVGGMLPSLQHFEGKRACCSSKMGTRTSDKQVNYSHELAQTKQQVG